MTEPLYNTDILRLAASLREPQALEREDGRAEVRSPTCGSRLVLAVMLDDDRRIVGISQTVEACAFGQASAALLEQNAFGKNHDEVAEALLGLSRWLSSQQDVPGDWRDLDMLAPARSARGRHGAILLPFRALLAALEAVR
jgi:NifU-like protein involved in Fe-S cluster formation